MGFPASPSGYPSSLTHVEIGALSHVGRVRATNQDHFLVARFDRQMSALLTNLPAGYIPERYADADSSDMKQIVERIRSSKADIILNTINGDSNIAFFRALKAAGISSSEIPTISFSASEDSLSGVRPQDRTGDYAVWNYFEDIDSTQNQSFVSRFHQRFGFDRVISDPMEAAYVAVQMWAKAVKTSGSEDPAVIRSALAGQILDAPEGKIQIDPDTMRTFKFVRIARMTKEGHFVVTYSSNVAIAPIPYPDTRSKAAWDAFLTDLQRGWGGQWANPTKYSQGR